MLLIFLLTLITSLWQDLFGHKDIYSLGRVIQKSRYFAQWNNNPILSNTKIKCAAKIRLMTPIFIAKLLYIGALFSS
jgi:hypothetical protein